MRHPWSPLAAGLAAVVLASMAAADDVLPPGESPPPTVFSRLEAAGTSEDNGGADEVIVYHRIANHVKPSGVNEADEYVLYKVLTPTGARNRSVLTWRYEPWSSRVEVREVTVVRGDRRLPVDVSLTHDLPAPQDGIYWNARIKTLGLPRLTSGDGIEVRTFRKGYSYALLDAAAAPPAPAAEAAPDDEKYVPPMPGEYFDIVLFQSNEPIIEKRYVLTLPPDKRLHSEIYNGPLYSSTTFTADTTRYEWWTRDVPARPREPRAADASDVVPKVVMATVESWEAKSSWFFDVNRNQFEVTPAIRAKVEEILRDAGLTNASEDRKAEALVHWVAQNIRYSGQTMGEGEGFTLHPGAMIFAQRSGVCKDIAGMLVTMMRAAGMDSYAAMTMAGSRIEETPADQFNHCVCALRKADGSFVMYDPTWVPDNNDIWSKYETEQQYLVGTPEGCRLSQIAYSPPDESPLKIRHEASLDDEGTLEGTFTFEGRGAMDTRLRNMVAYSRIADVRRDIAATLSHLSNRVEIVGLDYTRPDDFSRDARIVVRYRAPEYAFPAEDGLEFKSPMMTLTLSEGWFFRAGAYDWPEERKEDLFLWFTQAIDGSETVRLPNGYEVAEDEDANTIDETYAYFQGGSDERNGRLEVTERVEIRRRQIPPDGYAGFRKAIEEAKSFGDHVYRADKGGDR